MCLYTTHPLLSGGRWGISSAPSAPFLVFDFTSYGFCSMGRMPFLFSVPWACFILSSLSCELSHLCGSCLHTFTCLLSVTTQILACPFIAHLAHICVLNMLKHYVCPCHNSVSKYLHTTTVHCILSYLYRFMAS